MTCQPLYADGREYNTGNDLVRCWKEYKRDEAGQPCNVLDVVYFVGYVSGVADASYGRFILYPKSTTHGMLCSVAGKWIDNHPELWAEAPRIIVVTALTEAFPLQKRK